MFLGDIRGLMRREDWDSGLDGVWVAGRKNRRYGHERVFCRGLVMGVGGCSRYSIFVMGRVSKLKQCMKQSLC